jgi:hypothetical protein
LHRRHWIGTHDVPCIKCSNDDWLTTRHLVRLIFKIYSTHKVKMGKNFKTLRQNNAVLRRAALSGPKPTSNRARYWVFSTSHCGRPSDRLYCTFQISQGPPRNSGR